MSYTGFPYCDSSRELVCALSMTDNSDPDFVLIDWCLSHFAVSLKRVSATFNCSHLKMSYFHAAHLMLMIRSVETLIEICKGLKTRQARNCRTDLAHANM